MRDVPELSTAVPEKRLPHRVLQPRAIHRNFYTHGCKQLPSRVLRANIPWELQLRGGRALDFMGPKASGGIPSRFNNPASIWDYAAWKYSHWPPGIKVLNCTVLPWAPAALGGIRVPEGYEERQRRGPSWGGCSVEEGGFVAVQGGRVS